MLDDPREIEIISKAQQKNVRDPKRSRVHFDRIFADFLDGVAFEGQRFLDLGPGQYDFGLLCRQRGATVYNIDRDPAVVELGRYKNFEVLEGDLTTLGPTDFDIRFDGLFCKYSISAQWFTKPEQLSEHIDRLAGCMKDDAWGWIAPWNGESKQRPEEQTERMLAVQAESFMRHGFEVIELTDEQTVYYGVHGQTANRALFLKNLSMPAAKPENSKSKASGGFTSAVGRRLRATASRLLKKKS